MSNLTDSYINRQVAFMPEECLMTTDTMPGNFWHLGFIHIHFPNAPLIHMVRDPFDTCLQMFCQPYIRENEWSHSIQGLAHYYVHYLYLMEHWKPVLPEGRILDASYENLVTDPASELKKAAEYLSLELSPEQLDMNINTDEIGIAQKHYPEFCEELRKEQLAFCETAPFQNLKIFSELEKEEFRKAACC